MAHPELSKAIELIGITDLAKGLGITYQAIRKWEAAGRLPRTEWTGETRYAEKIVELSGDRVSKEALLERHVSDRPAADEPEPERRGPNLPKSGNGPSPGMEQSRNETGSRTQSGIEASPATSTSEATACRA